jgi:nicotinamide-nucleotide amidase
MASGVRQKLHTDYAIATSGVAGPDGGTLEKPVGTTWIAVATPLNVIAEKFQLGDDRERNIRRASLFGLNMLRKKLEEFTS